MEAFLYICLAGLIIYLLSKGVKATNENIKEVNAKMKNAGMDPSSVASVGKYVSGHPDVDKEFEYAVLIPKAENLLLAQQASPASMPQNRAYIPTANIKDVVAEDASTFEKRVTLGRVLLTGVFALAWKKKKKNEMAFLTIEWNDGRFDHSTVFNFEGAKAMETANTARNKIIRWVR